MNEQLDPTIQALARAIKRQETGDAEDAYTKRGASGEFGAYQFMPDTWKNLSTKYLGGNAEPTVENQNKAVYYQIKEWKDKGYNPAQIAAAWNAGEGKVANDAWKTNVGTNSYGVKYDTPSYVRNVSKYYQELKPQDSGAPHVSQYDFLNQPVPEADTAPVDKLGRVAGLVETLTDPLTAIGGGVQNAIRAGGRAVGLDTPAAPTVPSLLTGHDVDPIGYRNGEELGPMDTVKQGAGRALQAGSLAVAPELWAAAPLRTAVITGAMSGLGDAVAEDKSATDTALETAGGAGMGLGFGVGGKFLGKVFPKADEAINKEIMAEFSKAVKPTVVGKNNAGAVEAYDKNAIDALHTIAANKDELKFNTNGVEETGRTPESLNELGDAISQTKKTIYAKYNALSKAATGEGAKVETAPVVRELNKVADDQALNLSSPNTAQYAADMAERYGAAGPLDADVVEKVIQNYNSNLQSFYKNPTYDTASKVAVDAMVANVFRTELDRVIEGSTGAQYQTLKNLYGSLKAIEKDVIKRSIVNDRKQPIGLIDYADIFSAGDLIHGLATMNPAMFAKAAAQKGFKEYLKYLNSPDRAIKNIFKKITAMQEKGYASKDKPTTVTPKVKDVTGETKIPITKKPNVSPDQTVRDYLMNKGPEPKPEPYVPDSQLPTIDMGPKAKSKYQKVDKNLPSIPGFANTDLLMKMGIGSAAGLGAKAGYDKLSEMGHGTYERAPEPVTQTPVEDIARHIANAETRGEKTPYSFSQWSNKALGPASPLGKALGKYQITEARLKEKSKQFLGKAISAKDFLSSPELQDKFITEQIKWQRANGLTDDEILATHRYGWGNMKPEQIKAALAKSGQYIHMARNGK